MKPLDNNWLVTTDWLADHLDAPDLVVLDCSWHLPDGARNGRREYDEEHIPGALFFDIDEIADTKTEQPHMLPSAEKFSSRMRQMGIGDGMQIIVYDSDGLFSAPRVWWTFRVFGADNVRVLDGGLKKWKAEQRDTEDMPPRARTQRHFTSRRNASLVSDKADMLAALDDPARQIVDARSSERFSGRKEEPRAGLPSGHMPGALNLYYGDMINEDGTMKGRDELRALFDRVGVDLSKPVLTTCGSGITAAILALGLARLGHNQTSVYDGSWSEWAGDANMPVEKS